MFFFWFLWLLSSWLLIFSFGFLFFLLLWFLASMLFFPLNTYYTLQPLIYIYIYTVCILYRYISHLCTVQKDKPETNDLLLQSKWAGSGRPSGLSSVKRDEKELQGMTLNKGEPKGKQNKYECYCVWIFVYESLKSPVNALRDKKRNIWILGCSWTWTQLLESGSDAINRFWPGEQPNDDHLPPRQDFGAQSRPNSLVIKVYVYMSLHFVYI